jgi:hypothetical protein
MAFTQRQLLGGICLAAFACQSSYDDTINSAEHDDSGSSHESSVACISVPVGSAEICRTELAPRVASAAVGYGPSLLFGSRR